MALFVIAVALAMTGLTSSTVNLRHSAQTRDTANAHFLVVSALNDGFSEVRRGSNGGVDGTGLRADGFGAIGVNPATPAQFRTATNKVIAEYRTWIVNLANDVVNDPPVYVLRALVAVPNFANATGTYAGEARLTSVANFLFAPNTGALSVSGPVNTWQLNNWNNPDLKIDGGDYPAIVLTDEGSFNSFIDNVENNWDQGWGLSDNVTVPPRPAGPSRSVHE